MGVQASTLLRQVLALEKTGWLERLRDGAGTRRIALRGPGRQLAAEARVTAAAVCAAALAGVPAERLASCDAVLEALCASAALEVA
jgi:DNA-binding MarR family transcriptional regulator